MIKEDRRMMPYRHNETEDQKLYIKIFIEEVAKHDIDIDRAAIANAARYYYRMGKYSATEGAKRWIGKSGVGGLCIP